MKVNIDFFYEGEKYNVSCSSKDRLNTLLDKFVQKLNNESQIEEYSFFSMMKKLKKMKIIKQLKETN